MIACEGQEMIARYLMSMLKRASKTQVMKGQQLQKYVFGRACSEHVIKMARLNISKCIEMKCTAMFIIIDITKGDKKCYLKIKININHHRQRITSLYYLLQHIPYGGKEK